MVNGVDVAPACKPTSNTGRAESGREFGCARVTLRSGRAGSDDPGFVGEDDGLYAVAQAELGEHSPDVRLDGGVGHDELLGDLRVGEAAGDEFQDVELAGCQVVELWWRPRGGRVVADERVDQPPGDGRREQGFSLVDGADGCDELFGWEVFEQDSA